MLTWFSPTIQLKSLTLLTKTACPVSYSMAAMLWVHAQEAILLAVFTNTKVIHDFLRVWGCTLHPFGPLEIRYLPETFGLFVKISHLGLAVLTSLSLGQYDKWFSQKALTFGWQVVHNEQQKTITSGGNFPSSCTEDMNFPSLVDDVMDLLFFFFSAWKYSWRL